MGKSEGILAVPLTNSLPIVLAASVKIQIIGMKQDEIVEALLKVTPQQVNTSGSQEMGEEVRMGILVNKADSGSDYPVECDQYSRAHSEIHYNCPAFLLLFINYAKCNFLVC